MKTGRRIIIELVCILLAYNLGLYLMSQMAWMDVLLSPGGSESLVLILGASIFLFFRSFVIVCLPGWILARWYQLAQESRHTK